jgi:hypothetical protein
MRVQRQEVDRQVETTRVESERKLVSLKSWGMV